MNGYMLISLDDVWRIAEALTRVKQNVVVSEAARQDVQDALHILNTGLHCTNAVPADFRREART